MKLSISNLTLALGLAFGLTFSLSIASAQAHNGGRASAPYERAQVNTGASHGYAGGNNVEQAPRIPNAVRTSVGNIGEGRGFVGGESGSIGEGRRNLENPGGYRGLPGRGYAEGGFYRDRLHDGFRGDFRFYGGQLWFYPYCGYGYYSCNPYVIPNYVIVNETVQMGFYFNPNCGCELPNLRVIRHTAYWDNYYGGYVWTDSMGNLQVQY